MTIWKTLGQRPLLAAGLALALIAFGFVLRSLLPLPSTESPVRSTAIALRATALPGGTNAGLPQNNGGTPEPESASAEQATALPAPVGVTATPAVTSTPSNTPRPTATFTPSATPTPVLSLPQQLAAGLERQRLGDYGAAKGWYQAVRTSAPNSPEARLAAYYLGESALLNSSYEEAKTALEAALQEPLPAPQSARALYLLGGAYEGLEQWPDAVDAYKRYLAVADPVMNGPVQERIARAYLRQGLADEAAAAYTVALQQAPDRKTAFRLRETLASNAIAHKLYSVAISQYQAILSDTQLVGYRAEIEYDLGNVYDAAGQGDLAAQHWQLAMDADPTNRYAYRGLFNLVNAGRPVDDFQRGVINVNNQSWTAGAAALERYLQTDPTGKNGQAQFYLGKAYDALDRYPECYAAFDTVISRYPQSPKWAEAWIAKAAAQASPGGADPTGARETLSKFAQTYPQQALAVIARWNSANIAEQAKDWSGAAKEFRELQATYPSDTTYAAQALFRAGMAAFQGNDLAAASTAWTAALNQYPTTDWGRAARLWEGKLRLADGAPADAQALWAGLIRSPEADYNSERARALAAAANLPVETAQPLVPELPEQEQAHAETWLRTWLSNLPAQGSLAALDPSMASDPQLKQGAELWALDRLSDATDRLSAVQARLAGDGLAQYQLAIFFRDLGAYPLAIEAASRLAELSPTKNLSDLPVFVQKLLYPVYYGDLVEAEAKTRQVDPWLVFAIIRQESRFDATAYSSASANGLMQIIPDTGSWIALQLRWPNYQVSDLTRPWINVKFGTFYLANALRVLDGNVFSALAGYNAGPGNARTWRTQSGDDDDLFALTIPLRQPKLYVERVTANYAVYRRLYATR